MTTTRKKKPTKKKGIRRSIVVNELPEDVNPREYDREELFCQHRAMGMSATAAARAAGYADPDGNSYRINKRPNIQARVAELKKENQALSALSRQDVMAGVLDAIAIGRLQADSQAMIRGYNEINKMLGFHAPEKKVVELTSDGRRTMTRIQNMSEADLLEELGGDEGMTLEGEFAVDGEEEEEN